MTVADGSRFGTRGVTRLPSPEDVLAGAVELALTGAGLSAATGPANGCAARAGFLAVPVVAGAAYPRVSVTWQEGGEPSGEGLDGLPEELCRCEQALRRARFRVECRLEAEGWCLLVWRGLRAW